MKIESLEKFGTPDEIGARVMRVEREKDGTLDTKLFGATAEKQGDLSLYTLVSANGVKPLIQAAVSIDPPGPGRSTYRVGLGRVCCPDTRPWSCSEVCD